MPDMSAILPKLPFFKEFGFQIISQAPGVIVVSMPFDARFATPPDLYPASIVGTIGDVAAVASCFSVLPDGWAAATLDYTIKMLRQARGERLIARGRVLQNGRTISVGAADIFAIEGGAELHCGTVLATTRNFEIKR